MTPERLNEIEKLHAAATPGPWGVAHDWDRDQGANAWYIHSESNEELFHVRPRSEWGTHALGDPEAKANAEFAAAARNAIPGLIAEVRALTLTWTKGLPTMSARHYWYEPIPRDAHKELCYVYRDTKDDLFALFSDGNRTSINELPGRWAGPIPTPIEPEA